MSKPGKYFFYHSSKIAKKFITTRHMLDSGLVIDCFYTPKDTQGKSKIQAGRRYIALVLHPKWGKTSTKYTHALVLDHMPGPVFNKFAENIGLEYSERYERVKKIKIPVFDMDKDEARDFYRDEVKLKLKHMHGWQDCYRTFLYDRFSRIFVVDYKFNKPALLTIDKKK